MMPRSADQEVVEAAVLAAIETHRPTHNRSYTSFGCTCGAGKWSGSDVFRRHLATEASRAVMDSPFAASEGHADDTDGHADLPPSAASAPDSDGLGVDG